MWIFIDGPFFRKLCLKQNLDHFWQFLRVILFFFKTMLKRGGDYMGVIGVLK